MARALNRLSARQIEALKKPGRHADGGGLYFRITNHGARSWVFLSAKRGKRVDIGLGAASSVSLATARRLAEKMREAIATGTDPRQVISPQIVDAPVVSTAPLWADWRDTFIEGIETGFRNAVHREQWKSTLKTHAKSLDKMRVDAIGTDDVVAVLRPIWTEIPETASRVRGRIERILDAAAAKGFRDPDKRNPATWKGHLEHFLPKRMKKSLRGHHEAVPWEDMPAFWADLAKRRDSTSVQALRFTILTVARTGEVIGARVREFDLEAKIWTVPAERMKMGVEHQVALSEPVLEIVRTMSLGLEPGDYLFPGLKKGASLSNMAMLMLLKDDMKRSETVHGFRSSFRDWAGDGTNHPRELAEMALAHAVGDATEAAYRRGRALEKRRVLMSDWAGYLEGAAFE